MRRVRVVTTLTGFEDWHLDVEVPWGTKVSEFKMILAGPPHYLDISVETRILHKNKMTHLKDFERIRDEVALSNVKPTKTEGMTRNGSHSLGIRELFGWDTGPGFLEVTVQTTLLRCDSWELKVQVPRSTTVQAFKDILRRPPHKLEIAQTQKVLMRMEDRFQGHLGTMRDNERVRSEVLLLSYEPTECIAIEDQTVQKLTQASDSADFAARWEESLKCFELAKERHAEAAPLERRAYSWCRTIAFTEVLLKITGHGCSRASGTKNRDEDTPLVYWILDATEEVEGYLVENGFFDDVGLFENGPVECYIMGPSLNDYEALHEAGPLTESWMCSFAQPLRPRRSVRFRKLRYVDEVALEGIPKPDLVLVMCAEFSSTIGDGRPHIQVPRHVMQIAKAAGACAALTTRFKFWEPSIRRVSNAIGDRLLIPPVRSPFSSQAADQIAEFDDNGWVMAFQDVDTMAEVLRMDLRMPFIEPLPPENRLPAIFWGIIDLKYDPRLPILERVKVLETGDGRSSKFSNHGAEIPKRFRARHRLEDGLVNGRFTVVSNNKKLTHDEMVIAGYKHLVPKQVCLPRVYDFGLAQRIIDRLEVADTDILILKLCNRARAAGILPVPVGELDEVLEELLEIPEDMEDWFQRKLARGTAETFDLAWGCFEEQCRHWWSNECPFFVVEPYCASLPVMSEVDEKLYDGTLRVAFALRRRENKGNNVFRPKARQPSNLNFENPSPDMKHKEELELEWLGGYWKLPKEDVDSNKLRERIVSAARTKGTGEVKLAHLHDIYAALGDSVQKLFNLDSYNVTDLMESYKETPYLAAYFTARLAVTQRDLAKGRQTMNLAASEIAKMQHSFEKSCIESYMQRGLGVFSALQPPGLWSDALDQFILSIETSPSNATAWYLKGMALLELGRTYEAIDPMKRALLLDLDFKAPYVNLGVAFLRLLRLDDVIEISEALLRRHPESPQCHYHISVALFLKSQALAEEANGDGANFSQSEVEEYEALRKRAFEEMMIARDSDEGQRLQYRSPSLSPFLQEDDQIVNLLRPSFSIVAKTAPRLYPVEPVVMPRNVGWRFFGWRT